MIVRHEQLLSYSKPKVVLASLTSLETETWCNLIRETRIGLKYELYSRYLIDILVTTLNF